MQDDNKLNKIYFSIWLTNWRLLLGCVRPEVVLNLFFVASQILVKEMKSGRMQSDLFLPSFNLSYFHDVKNKIHQQWINLYSEYLICEDYFIVVQIKLWLVLSWASQNHLIIINNFINSEWLLFLSSAGVDISLGAEEDLVGVELRQQGGQQLTIASRVRLLPGTIIKTKNRK